MREELNGRNSKLGTDVAGVIGLTAKTRNGERQSLKTGEVELEKNNKKKHKKKKTQQHQKI